MLFILLLLFTTLVAWLGYRFITADGDLTLLRKGPARLEAVKDKVVWITGASQGIGEALAQQFAQLGAKLILSSRRPEELERVKASLSGPNVRDGVVLLPMDIASSVEVLQEVVTKAEAAFNGAGVDYMVHNAAHTRPKFAALDATEEFLKDTFAINVMGTIHLTRLLVPSMINRGGGNIVVLADKNIKITVACPGPIETSPSIGDQNAENMKRLLSERRMPVSRCAELIIIAATHGLKEAWISYHPVLFLFYVTQYFPSLAYAIIDKVGPKRVSSQGQQAYSARLFFGQKKGN